METRILVVEDEEKLARFIELELGYEGYQVTKASDGRRGLELAETGAFDLLLLDIMLPGLSGMEVLRRRAAEPPCPLSYRRRGTAFDKVQGLDGGADDYITKPFAIEELLARIRTALRKVAPPPGEVLTASGLTLDTARHAVSVNGRDVSLTKREFDLLHYLMKNKGLVVSREKLLEHVWGFDYEGETNAVDVYIRFLRGKIDEAFDLRLIHTVRGVGYVIRDE